MLPPEPLIDATLRGDRTAFRRLFEQHGRAVYAVCARLLGDPALAEDAVQETFLRAHRGLAQFDRRAAFTTWLHRIAVNTALELQRKRGVVVAEPEIEHAAQTTTSAPAHDPMRHAAGAELQVHLGRALGRLSALERTAFVLRHVEQYPLDEIADHLRSNANACKQAIFRAVRKLRTDLSDFEASVP